MVGVYLWFMRILKLLTTKNTKRGMIFEGSVGHYSCIPESNYDLLWVYQTSPKDDPIVVLVDSSYAFDYFCETVRGTVDVVVSDSNAYDKYNQIIPMVFAKLEIINDV